jgi:hypothetical protein
VSFSTLFIKPGTFVPERITTGVKVICFPPVMNIESDCCATKNDGANNKRIDIILKK